MSGSRVNADVDAKMLESVTRDIEGDGLWWLQKLEDRPWRAVPDAAHSVVADAVAAVWLSFLLSVHERQLPGASVLGE